MDISNKSKWQVRLAALLIFVLGVAAGALGLNGYQRWSRSRAEGSRQQRFERMLDRLQLNQDQKSQVHQILTESRDQLQNLRKESEPRFSAIRQQADERLQKVLTPEQWKQFQQERDANRGRERRGGRPDNR
jgi:Spy/CpxP family protein refolding chaperone